MERKAVYGKKTWLFHKQLNVLRESSEKAPWKTGALTSSEEREYSLLMGWVWRAMSMVYGATYLTENSRWIEKRSPGKCDGVDLVLRVNEGEEEVIWSTWKSRPTHISPGRLKCQGAWTHTYVDGLETDRFPGGWPKCFAFSCIGCDELEP